MGNTPLWGVAHAVGGWGALGLRTSPTRQVGWDPAWWMGEVRKPSAPHPPTAWATPHSGVLPTPQVGRDQLPLSHKPTASVREPLPSMTEATSMAMGGGKLNRSYWWSNQKLSNHATDTNFQLGVFLHCLECFLWLNQFHLAQLTS